MDLSTLDVATSSNQGVEIELYHPVTRAPLVTVDGQKLTVTLVGKYSDKYQKIQRQINNRRLAQRGKLKITAEELEAESEDLLANCIVGWKNIVVDGTQLECSYGNALKILKDKRFAWFRDQVDEAVNDDANFIKR